MKIAYEEDKLASKTLKVIEQANAIIAVYGEQGYDLTLRQLYYQFVSRGLMENTLANYKRLGDIVSKGRRAGLIDWDSITDRTRFLRRISTWERPSSIIQACASQFRFDLWAHQAAYVEIWFEKDALMGVFERAAERMRVPYFSCRGYTSDSEVWAAARRLAARADESDSDRDQLFLETTGVKPKRRRGKAKARKIVILHFGDHDPSGLDMTRDIRERLELFGAGAIEVRRLALNMAQIELYKPPPNPAKETDSRFAAYRNLFGEESWELDALEPTVLAKLVEDELKDLVDWTRWASGEAREAEARREIGQIANNYNLALRLVEEAT